MLRECDLVRLVDSEGYHSFHGCTCREAKAISVSRITAITFHRIEASKINETFLK